MKTGFENKRNVVTLAVLGVILLVAAGYFVDKVFVGGPAPTPVPHASTEEPQPAAENAGTASQFGIDERPCGEESGVAGDAGSDAASGADGGCGVAGVCGRRAEYFLHVVGAG